jgi:hypothetical protein
VIGWAYAKVTTDTEYKQASAEETSRKIPVERFRRSENSITIDNRK